MVRVDGLLGASFVGPSLNLCHFYSVGQKGPSNGEREILFLPQGPA